MSTKHVIALLVAAVLCGTTMAAYVNPMTTVKNASVDGIAAILESASQTITKDSPANQKMDLVVAYGLAYLKQTDKPTWDAYFNIIQTKSAEYGVTDRIVFNGNVYEVLRSWWIGAKSNKDLLQPAIAYITTHPHPNLVLKVGALCADIGDHEAALKWFESSKHASGVAIRSYVALDRPLDAINYYYNGLENYAWSAQHAREQFNIVWKLVLDNCGSDTAKLATFKQKNAKYASMYTNKMYESAKPESSPWRSLVTILTAQSK